MVHLFVVLMEEEELLCRRVAAAKDHPPLSDSVWLSLASTFVGFEDVVYTIVAVAPV